MAKTFVGGLALIEGVMMLFQGKFAIAVQTDKKITTKTGDLPLLRSVWARIPVIRGIIVFLYTLIIGTKAMSYSASLSLGEEENLSSGAVIATLIFSLVLALVLFKLVPLFLTTIFVARTETVLFNIVDGILRISIFIGYIWIISFMEDVKRLFQYHGAEHKTINAYEKGKLSVKEIMKASRFHPRCGTTFVVLVLIVTILVMLVVPLSLPFWYLLLVRIALMLPIAGLTYEVIKLAGSYHDNPIMKVILAPGYWVQKLTTNEPDEQQVKVALKALKSVL